MVIRIFLVDDHRLIREGLRSLLESRSGISVVGQADDGRSAVESVLKLRPDVVIMDITMPGLNGIEATRQILADLPAVKVIALSMHSDPRMVAAMFKAGALGYVLKDSIFADLLAALHAVHRNRPYFSPQVASIVLEGYLNKRTVDDVVSSIFSILTPREREVLQLIAEGQSTKEIAAVLYITVKTVEKHRAQIMAKLGVHSVARLTRYAIREGLISLE